MISEDRLRQAVRDAGALLDQSLPDPDQCHHTFSPAFLNRMEALLRRRKRAPVYRVLKGVACFFLAFLLGGTIFLSTMPRHGRRSLGGCGSRQKAHSDIFTRETSPPLRILCIIKLMCQMGIGWKIRFILMLLLMNTI